MQFKFTQAVSVLALAAVGFSSPLLTHEDHSVATRGQDQGAADLIALADRSLAVRGKGKGIGEIVEAVIDMIRQGIADIDQRQHDGESNFTQSTVANLQAANPDKNILIFHNQASKTNNFVNSQHQHVEYNIGTGTQGYEIFVFDSGEFERSGDGGYINWCCSGNFKQDGSKVTFAKPGGPAPKRKMKMRRDVLPAVTYSFGSVFGSPAPPTISKSQSKGAAYGGVAANSSASKSQALHSPVTYTAPVCNDTLIAPTAPTSGKAQDDGYYFVQCQNTQNQTVQQGIAYYKQLVPHGGNKNQQPDDLVWLSAANVNGTTNAHADWKFQVGAVTFPDTQVAVHWNMFGPAAGSTVSTAENAGFADNGKEHFWMYKGDATQLFQQEAWACNSLYFAY